MLKVSKCECGKIDMPDVNKCIDCGKPTAQDNVDGIGNILSYTVVEMPPEGFPAPLYLVMVGLSDNLKLLCRGSKNLTKIGAKVIVMQDEETFYCEEYRWLIILKKKFTPLFKFIINKFKPAGKQRVDDGL
ncbi:MAG: hypothetical protein AB1765_06820 [Candidatus Hydrogenedentota bacterium]